MLPPLLYAHRGRISPAAVGGALVALLIALVGLRSWVFMSHPHAHFDSDQAVFGIMAEDIARARAFPLFMYGQRYMLALGSWLCAPLFALFGASIFMLKLPMLAMNIACVAMLWIGLRREPELAAFGAALAIVPFAVGSVVVASRLVEHQGGNIEPVFFLLLAFLLRERAVVLGIVFGIAILNREFALLGLPALLIMDAFEGALRSRLRARAITAATGAAVIALVRFVASRLPGYVGVRASGTLKHVLHPDGLAGYFKQQLPVLLGAASHDLRDFNIASELKTGQDWLGYVALGWALIGVVAIGRMRRPDVSGMPAYLILVGAGQAVAFVLLCGAPFDPSLVRYVLVHLLFWVGITAQAWKWRPLRAPLAVCVLAFAGANARDHVRLIEEYAHSPPRHENELLAAELLARGVRYAEADYWVAYDVTWLTGEKILASPPPSRALRVQRYRKALDEHPSETVRITTDPCPGGSPVLRWFVCRPSLK